MAKTADKVIYGNIYTVDQKLPRAKAAAIADGRFVFVGDELEAEAYIGEGTEVQRFEGGIILPGFGEGHGHISPGGTEALFTVHLNPYDSLEVHLKAVKEFAESHPELDVIQGAGFIPTPDMGPNGPTADLLDGLTDKPVVLADIGHHSYWVNHAAMNRLGINKDTLDVSDGIITRDKDGNPTGYFREGAIDFMKPLTVFSVEQTGPHDLRDAVTHLQVVDLADIPRMAKLGIVAVTDPHWFDMEPEYFDMIAAVLGEERAEHQLPMKSFFDAGVVVTSASDYPVINPAYPLISIQKGVIRQLPGQPETLHNPAERVTVEQMIEAATLNEAYQLLCEDRLGSITAGKEADLVVLGTDITTCDPEHIQDAPVLGTMVGGEWV